MEGERYRTQAVEAREAGGGDASEAGEVKRVALRAGVGMLRRAWCKPEITAHAAGLHARRALIGTTLAAATTRGGCCCCGCCMCCCACWCCTCGCGWCCCWCTDAAGKGEAVTGAEATGDPEATCVLAATTGIGQAQAGMWETAAWMLVGCGLGLATTCAAGGDMHRAAHGYAEATECNGWNACAEAYCLMGVWKPCPIVRALAGGVWKGER